MADSSSRKHVVVLGGGFGGLKFIEKFRHSDVQITLVDQNNHHLFQPLLYQVATAGLSMPSISEPLRSIFSNRPDVTSLMAKVTSIDLDQKVVHLEKGSLNYDYLVIGLGAVTCYFGNSEWEKHSQGLKCLRDAMVIRRQMLTAFEEAENEEDPERQRELMTVIVIGGGPTGVELAGSFAELVHRVFLRDFRRLDPKEARVILLHSRDKVLNYFPDPLPTKAQHALEKLGVEVHLNSRVKSIEKNTVKTADKEFRGETILWTAGVVANPITKTMKVPQNKRGQLEVESDCSLPGHPEVFAIGDIVSLKDINGQMVPGVAPAAMQMGKYVAEVILDEFGGSGVRRKKGFAYFDKGIMATIGRKAAVVAAGNIKIDGLIAWLMWLVIHLMFLIGFRNKVFVLMSWLYAYSRYRSGARIIVDLGRKEDDSQ
ncbi:MAG: NAD(P)/FAD-dependent oxidoreductase [Verrucomicrobiota bacterium]